MRRTAVQALAEFVVEAPRDRHPAAAVERATYAVLDTLGCILLGAESDVARLARQSCAAWGAGDAPAFGTHARLPPPWAAMVNGVAGHAFDLDDFTFVANDHPSTVMLPALLAAAHGRERELTGMHLLDAYLIGLEVTYCLGEAVNMGHYKLGWHTTSTLDSLGAAAAVSRLWRLDVAKTAAALSLATSMGSGYVSQFGTSAKPLHAGFAAKAGLVAASLAAAGATAQLEALDGAVSFASLLVPEGEADFPAALAKLGAPWGIEAHGLGAKVYPSCGYAHRCVDAAIEARAELGLTDIAQVQTVSASLPAFHLSVLPYGVPTDRTQALFSTAYCVATALATGDNRIEDFSPAALRREDVLALTRRVDVVGRAPKDPELNFDEDDPDCVEVWLVDGRNVRCEVATFTGAPGRDLDRSRFLAKFESCHRHYAENGGALDLSVVTMVDAIESLSSATDLVRLNEACSGVVQTPLTR